MATRQEVLEFLRLFKACVMLARWNVMAREKNRQALLDLGIDCEERRETLLGLEPEDYLAGPKPDLSDRTREVWEFGTVVGGTDVYIKLRVMEDPREKKAHRALVWSFHPAERPLRYPLRGGGS